MMREKKKREKKKDVQDTFRKYLAAGLFFVVALAIGLVTFFYRVQEDVEKNIERSVSESVSTQSYQLKTILDAQYDYLEGVAAYVGQAGRLTSGENMTLLRHVQEESELERVSIIRPDGTAYYDNGNVSNVADRRYFQEGMEGQRVLSDPLESRSDGQTRVVLAVPVYRDGQVIGVLGGSYDVTALSRMMFQNIYDGAGFSFILKEDGDVLSCDSANTLGIDLETNFFQWYAFMFHGEEIPEQVRNDFAAGESGYLHLKLDEGEEHLAYAPLGYNNWTVCYTVKAAKTQEGYAFIREYEMVLVGWFILAVLALLVIMQRISRKKQKELQRDAYTDALTGLYNRKHTEERIQASLQKETGKRRGIQAFLLMDIDFFKEINDQYGHAAGDEVLRRVGAALKGMFRKDCIVGRIGGDEFVVFLKTAADLEAVERRTGEVPALFRSLNVPELQGRTLTCSIGVACAPDQGQDYLELYKRADIAMYKTKEKGRNGYTIYREEALWDQRERLRMEDGDYVHRAYTEINPLTGLYYNKAFLKIVDDRLKSTEKNTYALVAVDIEHFRLFNRLYGREEGDKLLIGVAEALRETRKEYGGVVGYLSGDNFCIFLPDTREALNTLQERVVGQVRRWSTSVGFLPGFGVYRISDPSVPAVAMYDWAMAALKQVYGNYAKRICFFEKRMLQKEEEEVRLVSDVQRGLKDQEFLFYVQPQCSIADGKIRIVGAECLVRWQHKERGMISPGVFIPVLEKTGFVSELDRYIWKKVCRWLKSWIERGNTPIPVSINLSRTDIFSMDVTAYLKDLVASCGVAPRLVKVEITESAYAENDDRIVQAVKQLRDAGFDIMMDDFGSGYSSLSMLKNVSVDVLKTDMKFLENEGEEQKGNDILESVVNMSRQLGIPVIVEGIENKKQEEFLLRMGVRYAQGYYYYKPMPVLEFEGLISNEKMLDRNGFTASQVADLRVREFMDQSILDDQALNRFLGAAAMYDVYRGRVRIIRVNQQYCRIAGADADEAEDGEQKFWSHVQDEDRPALLAIFERAYRDPQHGGEGSARYLRADGRVLTVYMRIFFLREREGHRTFYGTLTDVSSLAEPRKKRALPRKGSKNRLERDVSGMERYYDRLPYGVGVGELTKNRNGKPLDCKMIFWNEGMGRLLGRTDGALAQLIQETFFAGRTEFLERCSQAAYQGKEQRFQAYSSVSCKYVELTMYAYARGYVGFTVQNATRDKVEEQALKGMLSACREVYFIQLEDNYYRMIYPDPASPIERGNYLEAINRHFGTGKILGDNVEEIRTFLSPVQIRESLMQKNVVEMQYPRSCAGSGREWCRVTLTAGERRDGVPITAVMCIYSIEHWLKRKEKIQISEMMQHMADGFFVYEAVGEQRILYANPAVLKLFGCASTDEFLELTGGSFRGMVYPEDWERIGREINEQIDRSGIKMDYIEYRIRKRDGAVIWVEDYGHRVDQEDSGNLFYVFISELGGGNTGESKVFRSRSGEWPE